MAKFWLGKIIKIHEIEFNNYDVVKVIQYIPSHREDPVGYCIEEINQSAESMEKIILAYIVYKQLGLNQGPLLEGISRMLKLAE